MRKFASCSYGLIYKIIIQYSATSWYVYPSVGAEGHINMRLPPLQSFHCMCLGVHSPDPTTWLTSDPRYISDGNGRGGSECL